MYLIANILVEMRFFIVVHFVLWVLVLSHKKCHAFVPLAPKCGVRWRASFSGPALPRSFIFKPNFCVRAYIVFVKLCKSFFPGCWKRLYINWKGMTSSYSCHKASNCCCLSFGNLKFCLRKTEITSKCSH